MDFYINQLCFDMRNLMLCHNYNNNYYSHIIYILQDMSHRPLQCCLKMLYQDIPLHIQIDQLKISINSRQMKYYCMWCNQLIFISMLGRDRYMRCILEDLMMMGRIHLNNQYHMYYRLRYNQFSKLCNQIRQNYSIMNNMNDIQYIHQDLILCYYQQNRIEDNQ